MHISTHASIWLVSVCVFVFGFRDSHALYTCSWMGVYWYGIIFRPCELWIRGLAIWENCRRATAAVAVIWKFRLRFRPGNYVFRILKLDVDSHERYQDSETVVLHRISSRISLAE